MSYQVENKGMVLLGKTAEALEELEKGIEFLDVNVSDIPRSDDRFAYTEDTLASDFQMNFIYKGKGFRIQAELQRNEDLNFSITEKEDYKFVTATTEVKDGDSHEKIKQKWLLVFDHLEKTFELRPVENYYFQKWAEYQLRFIFSEPKNKRVCDNIYKELIQQISPLEIEGRLKERYSIMENRIDANVSSKISEEMDIRMLTFLDGLCYIVLCDEEVFVYNDRYEAFKKYKQENYKKLEKALDESFDKYEVQQKRINENQ